MSDRLDRTLEVLDVGLQSSTEHGYPAGTDVWHAAPADDPELCARCQRNRQGPAGADLCFLCRDFLLGDSDLDPAGPCWFGVPVEWPDAAEHYRGNPVGIIVTASTGDGPILTRAGREHLEALAAQARVEERLTLTPGQVDALAAAFTRMADSVAEWANQVVSSLSAWFEHVQTEAWFQALTQAAQSATEALPSRPLSARDRERELLDHHRRSHRRTNRWGPPPGRR